jgi:hypothetical protein
MAIQFRTRRPVLTAFLALTLLGCDSSVARPSLDRVDATACEVAPMARQLAVELRAAVTATKRGDAVGVANAAAHARELSRLIADAIRGLNEEPTSRTVVITMWSIVNFGEQMGFFFGEAPNPDDLLGFDANLSALDTVIAEFEKAVPPNC